MDLRVVQIDYDKLITSVSDLNYVLLQLRTDQNADALIALATLFQDLKKEAMNQPPTTVNKPPWDISHLDKAAAFPSVDKV